MQAAYPFIDDFLPAGSVANLERLGRILAGEGVSGRPGGRPHRRAGGHSVPREIGSGESGPRKITPNPGAGKRLGAWGTKSPSTSTPRALGNGNDPSEARALT